MKSTTAPYADQSPLTERFVAKLLALVLLLLLVHAASALAAAPEKLFRVPADGKPSGSAGRLSNPRDIAANPVTGHVYVVDINNARINEFTAWGAFVKALGWDVAPEGAPGDTPSNQFEICTASCQAGEEGDGAGQFALPVGAALDTAGDIYIYERDNRRVQKFSPAGEFLLSFGRDVVASGPSDSSNEEQQKLTIAAVSGTFSLGFGDVFTGATGSGVIANGSVTVSNVKLTGGTFAVGNGLAGTGITPGTTIVAVGAGTLTLSQPAKQSISGVSLHATDIPHDASAATVEARLNALPSISGGGGSVSVSGGPGDGTGSSPYTIGFKGGLQGDDVPAIAPRASFPGASASISVDTVSQGGGPEICRAVLDVCKAGASGVSDGAFSDDFGNFLTYSPLTDTVFVGSGERIQEFETDGSFKSKIAFAEVDDLKGFIGEPISLLEADDQGNLYMAVRESVPLDGIGLREGKDVYKLDSATGEILAPSPFPLENPRAVATDSEGNVYIGVDPPGFFDKEQARILGFDSSGKPIPGMEFEDRFGEPVGVAITDTPNITGLGVNLCAGSEEPGNLYASFFFSGSSSYLDAYGTAPIGCEPPPLVAPTIEAQYATSVDIDGAVLKAQINPRFWTDATYYVQYGTGKCTDGGCDRFHPVSPGTKLTKRSINAPVTTAGLFLAGLEPDTTYHYRFVAQSSGSDGEEVIGVGGKPGVPGEEASFRTFAPPTPDPGCDFNRQFRTGPSARLPDCRAYEMVSPLDKNNGDIIVGLNLSSLTTGFFAGADSGQRVTYSSLRSFGDPHSAPFASQYLASRDPEQGWSTEAISPPMTRRVLGSGPDMSTAYKAFSPDLCTAWLRNAYDPPLTEDAVPGFANIYRRENCGAQRGAFEALTPIEPPNAKPEAAYFLLEFQGASADGSHSIYVAPDNLTEDAFPQPVDCVGKGTWDVCELRLYEHVAGQAGLRFVCILPNGNATKESCSAGTLEQDTGESRFSSRQNAISADGGRIFWTESKFMGPGRIYVRFEGEPTSRRVSQSVSAASARFWGAAEDGTEAIFEIVEGPLAGNLYRFDVDADQSTLIAKGTLGVMGIGEDAGRVYFASTEALPGSGQNSEGDEAVPGEANLYLDEGEGGKSFIATLADGDAGENAASAQNVVEPSPISKVPRLRTSRVTPDGLHAAFMSTASLTGYDNADAVSGEPDAEVFLYDAGANDGVGKLVCASCNPSGARPSGAPLRATDETTPLKTWIAAKIPAWERDLYASRALSADGTRLFFESLEQLTPRDTNGVQDVYQWEKLGSGECDAADSSFVEDSGGCVDLISSGESPRKSTFVDASATGSDVYITTLSSLLPQDYGLVDIYDAREGGGLPPPPAPPVGCEGEACQGPVVAPDDPTPGSSTFEGAGNVVEPPPARKCAKGRRAVRKAGRTRCVKKPRRAKHAKRANTKGRAGR